MTLKRSGVRRRPRDTGPTSEALRQVDCRDRGRCAVCGVTVTGYRGVDWSVQHRLRRGAGGTQRRWINWPSNLVLMCGSGTTRCHGRVESNREWASEHGFRVVDGVTLPCDVPILHAVHGLVLLTDEGGVVPCPTD